MIMNPTHKDWDKFCEILEGPEGCDFKKNNEGKITWKCKGGEDQSKAEAILKKHFPDVELTKSLDWMSEHGGHCDCEILFNCAD